MKRTTGALLCTLSLVAVAASAQDLAAIKERGALRVVAVADEQPEMFSFEAGDNPGFEREMLEGFARLQGLRFEVVQAPRFDDRIPMLLDGRGDVAIGMVVTPERAQQIDFTVQVLPVRHVVVNHEPAEAVASAEALRGLEVGVLAGTSWARAAEAAGVRQPEEFSDLDALLSAVRDGKVAATVMTVSDFTLATKRYPGLQAGAFLDDGGEAAWGVRKGSPALRQALDAYLENLRKGPSWSRLVVKYFGAKALDVLGRR